MKKLITILLAMSLPLAAVANAAQEDPKAKKNAKTGPVRSEEHTSELQSRSDLVCRLLLEKKKKQNMCAKAIIVLGKKLKKGALLLKSEDRKTVGPFYELE